jgi:hypothetical protein
VTFSFHSSKKTFYFLRKHFYLLGQFTFTLVGGEVVLYGASLETAGALAETCPFSVADTVYHIVEPAAGSGTVAEVAPAVVAGLAVQGPVALVPV